MRRNADGTPRPRGGKNYQGGKEKRRAKAAERAAREASKPVPLCSVCQDLPAMQGYDMCGVCTFGTADAMFE